MLQHDPNLPLLTRVAEALGDLCAELVFVVGCAVGLLITDAAAGEARATQDVDAVVEATSLSRFYAMEARLRPHGFVRDVDSGVICRWTHRASGAQFDLMPSDSCVLGFANRWYPEAVRTATPLRLNPQLQIRVIAAPVFVATKLEAFETRGKRDYLASHDLEDVLNIVEGRAELAMELQVAIPELRAFVQAHFRALLAERHFADNLPGLVTDPDQVPTVLQRLREIAA